MKSCYRAARSVIGPCVAFAVLICVVIAAFAKSKSPEDLKAGDLLDLPALKSPRAPNSYLTSVAKAGKRLVAVGEHGYVILSDDNGATWRQAKSVPVRVLLTAVGFANEKTGWAVGHSGVVLSTNDGGETWEKQLDGTQVAQIVLDTVKANPALANAVSTSALVETPLHSAERLVREGPDKPFFDIFVESEKKAIILGAYNLILCTEDGGKTWQSWRHHTENPREMHLYQMVRVGEDFFIAGEQGLVLRSTDKGLTFKKIETPYVGSFFGLVAARTGEIVVFGLRGNAFWSGDKGKTWQKIETGIANTFSAGKELQDGSLVLSTIAGELITSKDQGRTFQRLPVPVRNAVADFMQLPDGGLIFVGLRGAMRIDDLKTLAQETRTGK